MSNNSTIFLYQKSQAIVTDGQMTSNILKLLEFAYYHCAKALELYSKNQIHLFDPHVGDASCQIRAMRILELQRHPLMNTTQIAHKSSLYKEYYQKISSLIKNMHINLSINPTKHTIFEYLKSIDCLFSVDEIDVYLTMSYVLTQYKGQDEYGDSYLDIERLAFENTLTRKTAKKLTRHYQIYIAEQSCKNVYHWASQIPYYASYVSALKSTCWLDVASRPTLPCYLQVEVILAKLSIEKYSILIIVHGYYLGTHIKTFNMLYRGTGRHHEFIPVSKDQLITDASTSRYWTIEGVVILDSKIFDTQLYFNKFRQYPLREIIMMNIATHPQHKIKNNDFDKMTSFHQTSDKNHWLAHVYAQLMLEAKNAVIAGCCMSYPTLFWAKHIFSSADINYHSINQNAKIPDDLLLLTLK